MRLSPPVPEVQYLPAVFRKIQMGEIRIPAFQRDFVWDESQILKLLESVYKGYPIGSILFWRVSNRTLKVEASGTSVFPTLPEKYPLNYVLDGLQRLTALYGCFHWKSVNKESVFNVMFDLDTESFLHFRNDSKPGQYIYLSRIFNPKDFIEAQSQLSKQPNSDNYLDIAVKLHSTFQEYLIPTVTISERTVDDVVEIFERINSTGTQLQTVDFLRAVTWSEQFDLNAALEELFNSAKIEGFEIPDEVLLKIFGMSLGKDPTSDSLLQLRVIHDSELNNALSTAKGILLKTLNFLKQHCLIYSYDFVPYQGQFLVLAKYAMESGPSFDTNADTIKKWFWTVSFCEGYRGKPDSYLIKDLKSIVDFIRGDLPTFAFRANITIEDIWDRYFTRNKALSAAFANLFALQQARSIITGDIIPVEEYMTAFNAQNYEPLLSTETIRGIPNTAFRSNRLLANTVLLSSSDRRHLKGKTVVDALIDLSMKSPQIVSDVFISQMLPENTINLIKTNSAIEFLKNRSEVILKNALLSIG